MKAEVLSMSLHFWDGSVAVAEMKMPSDLCSNLSWLLGRIEKLLVKVVPTESCHVEVQVPNGANAGPCKQMC